MENDGSLTIQALAPLIRRKKISPVELTRFLLARIERYQPILNAYITITAEIALTQARRAEREIVRGDYRGMLHGIPISLKDLFYTRGILTTAGSRVLKDFVPRTNAVAVNRLLDAGCVLLGKTNMHEFAFGTTNVNPHYGPVRNPWDIGRISGGSSGGSAASVVSAQAIAALGTDTGGSIRIPAAACGCVGFKPSRGRVPLDGVIPLSFSLDHAGSLARCVMDAAIVFHAIADPADSGDAGRLALKIRKGIRALRIGVPRQYFFDRVQPEVRRAVLDAADVFKKLGAEVREVDLEDMQETERLAAVITGCEALAFHKKSLEQRPQDYGEDVRVRLRQSMTTTAVEYIQALREAYVYAKKFEQAMGSVQILLAPSIPMAALEIGQQEIKLGRAREDVRSALLRLTRPGNLAGLPAISIPCGFSSDGLPIGLQLIGYRFGDADLLRAAYAYEQATPWHLQFPPDVPHARRAE